jgi:hypothetical protein
VAISHPLRGMNHLDRYLLASVPAVISLQKMELATVEQRVEAAISRIQTASLDRYKSISAISLYWKLDDTSGHEDSSLLINTISKLSDHSDPETATQVETLSHTLEDDVEVIPLLSLIKYQTQSMREIRHLFILYYTGHAVGVSTCNSLIIISKICS